MIFNYRWYEVERESGLQLVNNSGTLDMAQKNSPRAAKVTKVMEEMVKQNIRCAKL